MAKKTGRKVRYDSYVKPYLEQIEEWIQTMTENQIAEKLGIGASTFQYYKSIHPELAEAIKKGKQNLVADLRGTLIKRAKGYHYTETKQVTEAVHWPDEMYAALLNAGFTPQQIAQSSLVKTEIAHKEMAPDVAALNLALKNYDKENWSNDPQMLAIRKKELELREKQIENNSW